MIGKETTMAPDPGIAKFDPQLPRVAVFGASGRSGQAQVRQLLKAGYPTIAVTRNPVIMARPDFAGAKCVAADLGNVDSLKAVLHQADAVLIQLPFMVSPADSVAYINNFAQAAREAGCRRIVFNTQQWAPDGAPCGVPMCDFIRSLEDVLVNAGLDVTVFRPVIFMDNLLTLIWKVPIVEEGVYRYCHAPGMKASWIAMDDVANFMIAALRRPDLIGRRFNLGGPEALPIEKLVSQLSHAVGRPLAFEYLPPRDWARYLFARMTQATSSDDLFGASVDDLADTYEGFYTFNANAAQPPLEVDSTALLREIPVDLTRFAEWARIQDWTTARSRDGVGSLVG